MGAVLDAFRPLQQPPPQQPPAPDSAAGAIAATAAGSRNPAAAGCDQADSSQDATASGAELSQFFRRESTALQHHALALLGRVLHVDPTAIHAMRAAALWELAYGPAFFFFAQVHHSSIEHATLSVATFSGRCQMPLSCCRPWSNRPPAGKSRSLNVQDMKAPATVVRDGDSAAGLATAKQQAAAATGEASAANAAPADGLPAQQKGSAACQLNLVVDEEFETVRLMQFCVVVAVCCKTKALASQGSLRCLWGHASMHGNGSAQAARIKSALLSSKTDIVRGVQVSVELLDAAAVTAQEDQQLQPQSEAVPLEAAPGPVAAARAALRMRVVALTRAAAATGPETNEVECGKVRTDCFHHLMCKPKIRVYPLQLEGPRPTRCSSAR